MYKLVESKIVKPYKIFCSDTLNQLKNILRNDYDIECKFRLIWSGSKDIVTQNGNEPFDLDYNLYITRFPHNFDPNTSDKMKWLKDTIRNELNELLGDEGFRDAQDSTSVLTARRFLTRAPQKKLFSFDVAILAKNTDGEYCRLIHEKRDFERFYWNQVPSSHNIYDKADELKQYDRWEDIVDKYLELKNMYLCRMDYNHPSFIVFVEAVNQVYQEFENYWYLFPRAPKVPQYEQMCTPRESKIFGKSPRTTKR